MESKIPAGAKTETPTEVMTRLRKRKTWLWARLKTDPTFPRPFYLSAREPLFFQHEIDAWLLQQADKRADLVVEGA